MEKPCGAFLFSSSFLTKPLRGFFYYGGHVFAQISANRNRMHPRI